MAATGDRTYRRRGQAPLSARGRQERGRSAGHRLPRAATHPPDWPGSLPRRDPTSPCERHSGSTGAYLHICARAADWPGRGGAAVTAAASVAAGAASGFPGGRILLLLAVPRRPARPRALGGGRRGRRLACSNMAPPRRRPNRRRGYSRSPRRPRGGEGLAPGALWPERGAVQRPGRPRPPRQAAPSRPPLLSPPRQARAASWPAAGSALRSLRRGASPGRARVPTAGPRSSCALSPVTPPCRKIGSTGSDGAAMQARGSAPAAEKAPAEELGPEPRARATAGELGLNSSLPLGKGKKEQAKEKGHKLKGGGGTQENHRPTEALGHLGSLCH